MMTMTNSAIILLVLNIILKRIPCAVPLEIIFTPCLRMSDKQSAIPHYNCNHYIRGLNNDHKRCPDNSHGSNQNSLRTFLWHPTSPVRPPLRVQLLPFLLPPPPPLPSLSLRFLVLSPEVHCQLRLHRLEVSLEEVDSASSESVVVV